MYYVLVAFNIFMAAVAQMMLKKSATKKHTSIIYEYLNPWVIVGYALMGGVLISKIFAMHQGILLKELGAMGASSYFFVTVLSYLCFKETFNKKKIFSIAIITTGSIIFFL